MTVLNNYSVREIVSMHHHIFGKNTKKKSVWQSAMNKKSVKDKIYDSLLWYRIF